MSIKFAFLQPPPSDAPPALQHQQVQGTTKLILHYLVMIYGTVIKYSRQSSVGDKLIAGELRRQFFLNKLREVIDK